MEAAISRDGSGIYSKPSGTTAPFASNLISSTTFNTLIDDFVTDANTARPITAGGTGATSASAARTALGVQAADALLTAIAALTTSASRFLQFTGVDTVAVFDLFGTANTFTATQTGSRWGVSANAYFDANAGNPVINFATNSYDLFTTASHSLGKVRNSVAIYSDSSTVAEYDTVDLRIEPTPASLATNSAGLRGTIINTQNGDYTFVLGDSGKTIYHTSASTHTYTIPANASVAYPIGTIIQIENENGGGNVTLAITSDTLRWDASTGSRTIAANGSASIKKVASTTWRLVGVGIT